jgi:Helix-turn-helix domain
MTDKPAMNPKAKTVELLKTFRARAGMTQVQAARWCETPLGTYRDYEQGVKEPRALARRGLEAYIEDWEDQYHEITGQIFFDEPVAARHRTSECAS